MKIFISHSSYDKWVARQISAQLIDSGHQTFLDEKDIRTGESIDAAIQKHLADSDDLLVLISPISLKSHWVFIEIGGAKALGKKIVPILFHVQANEIPQPIAQLLAKDINDITKYYEELAQRDAVAAGAKPPPAKRKEPLPKTVGGFNIGDKVTVIDVSLLTSEDKEESPKWRSAMDKYSGVETKITTFTERGSVRIEADNGEWMWNVKWLRKG